MNRFLYCPGQGQGQGQIVLQLDEFDLVEKYFLCQYKQLFLHCVRDLASMTGFQNDDDKVALTANQMDVLLANERKKFRKQACAVTQIV